MLQSTLQRHRELLESVLRDTATRLPPISSAGASGSSEDGKKQCILCGTTDREKFSNKQWAAKAHSRKCKTCTLAALTLLSPTNSAAAAASARASSPNSELDGGEAAQSVALDQSGTESPDGRGTRFALRQNEAYADPGTAQKPVAAQIDTPSAPSSVMCLDETPFPRESQSSRSVSFQDAYTPADASDKRSVKAAARPPLTCSKTLEARFEALSPEGEDAEAGAGAVTEQIEAGIEADMRVIEDGMQETETRDVTNPLHIAAREGNVSEMERLVSACADLRALDAQGRSILRVAADNDQLATVEWLLRRQASVTTAEQRDDVSATSAASLVGEEAALEAPTHSAQGDAADASPATGAAQDASKPETSASSSLPKEPETMDALPLPSNVSATKRRNGRIVGGTHPGGQSTWSPPTVELDGGQSEALESSDSAQVFQAGDGDRADKADTDETRVVAVVSAPTQDCVTASSPVLHVHV